MNAGIICVTRNASMTAPFPRNWKRERMYALSMAISVATAPADSETIMSGWNMFHSCFCGWE